MYHCPCDPKGRKLPMLTEEPTFKNLEEYYRQRGKHVIIKHMFEKHPNRFRRYSVRIPTKDGDILVDYSKNRITRKGLRLLFELARARKLEAARNELFCGQCLTTDNRTALHVALRNRSHLQSMLAECKGVMSDVKAELAKMKKLSNQIISGEWRGVTGKKLTDVVNISNGCANTGPMMVCDALAPFAKLRAHFVSNIDATQLMGVLRTVSYDTTIFVIASKSFSTEETLVNAESARKWFISYANTHDPRVLAKHFVGVTANKEKCAAFGIDIKNIILCWNWVGGRFSMWSAMGLTISISLGFDNFEKLLDGANCVDRHFRNAPLERNAPVILGLLGIWYHNFYNAPAHAIVPFGYRLQRFASYVQQCEMGSNGKNITKSGEMVTYKTGPIILNEMGARSESFHLMAQQGTRIIPCDLIATVREHATLDRGDAQKVLLGYFVGHSEALLLGKPLKTIHAELGYADRSYLWGRRLLRWYYLRPRIPHMVLKGNRPTNSIMMRQLNPYLLGALIALYEHKTFVQGAIWDINSFDSYGVELGKEYAKKIERELMGNRKTFDTHDSSTNGLINFIKKHW